MFNVVVDLQSLQRSGSRGIAGKIHLEGPTGCFPEEGWFDFPVVILAWWVEGLSAVASGSSRSFEGAFMDGPFAYSVKAGEGRLFQIAWGERGHLSAVGVVNVSALLASAVEAGKQVVESCHSRGWQSSEVQALEKILSRVAA